MGEIKKKERRKRGKVEGRKERDVCTNGNYANFINYYSSCIRVGLRVFMKTWKKSYFIYKNSKNSEEQKFAYKHKSFRNTISGQY